MDRKTLKSYITPLKWNDNSSINKSNKRSYGNNISYEKSEMNNQKIKKLNNNKNCNKNNEKNNYLINKSQSKSNSKSKSKSKAKQNIEKYYSQLKTPLSYYKYNFKNKNEILNTNNILNNKNKNVDKNSKKLSTFINKFFAEQVNQKKKFSIKRKNKSNYLIYNNNSNNNKIIVFF